MIRKLLCIVLFFLAKVSVLSLSPLYCSKMHFYLQAESLLNIKVPTLQSLSLVHPHFVYTKSWRNIPVV